MASDSIILLSILDLLLANEIDEIEKADSILDDDPEAVPMARAILDKLGNDAWFAQNVM